MKPEPAAAVAAHATARTIGFGRDPGGTRGCLARGAGLTLKSFWSAQNAPLNFDPHKILLASIELSKTGHDRINEKGNRVWDDDKIRRVL